jgi:hypothetical protein
LDFVDIDPNKSEDTIMGLLFFWIIMAAIVAIVANSKGYDYGPWFLYGLLIWPIALVHIITKPIDPRVADRQALQAGASKKCPHCAELIKTDAIKCRFCGEAV